MDVQIRNNEADSRFEAMVGDERVGVADYRARPGALAFLHTETVAAVQGQGVGGHLIGSALAEARERGLDVLPFCPFVRDFIARHPDFVSLVPLDRRGAFGLPETEESVGYEGSGS